MQKNMFDLLKRLLFLAALCLTTGCTHQYAGNLYSTAMQSIKLDHRYQLTRKEPWVITADTRILVMRTQSIESQEDAMDTKMLATSEFNWLQANQTLTPRLNTAMFASFQQSLITQFGSVHVTQSNSVAEALVTGRAMGAQLLFVPAVISQNNGLNTQIEINQGQTATSRNLGLDTSSIRIAAYDVTSGKLVDLAQVHARGRYFAAESESTPQLAAKAASVYVAAISGGSI